MKDDVCMCEGCSDIAEVFGKARICGDCLLIEYEELVEDNKFMENELNKAVADIDAMREALNRICNRRLESAGEAMLKMWRIASDALAALDKVSARSK